MIPRLYVGTPLAPQTGVALSQEQAHYLRNVLRREAGAELRLFNERDGEFAALLSDIGKKRAGAEIGERIRAPEKEPDLVLLFAPVKRTPTEHIIQKGTELGVARFQPVLTARTNAERLKVERLQAIALEVAEQCGRLSVPSIDAPTRLSVALDEWPVDRRLIFCDEAGDDPEQAWGGAAGRAQPMLDAILSDTKSAAILIGPEGGFSPEERADLRARDFTTPVTLGPRILRADTAAIAAITLWQARAGDFRRS